MAALADRVGVRMHDGILRVGIDGVDGAGKTTLADKLAGALGAQGHRVIRASVDGFHNPRRIRYRRGRDSPEGFFRDTTNIPLLRAALLDPLSPDGSGRYRTRVFDHRTDSETSDPESIAEPPAILIVDGIFLQRPELRAYWDLSIFLDVPFVESYPRMAARDGSDADPEAASNRRYYEGQKHYLAGCRPREQADILVDYADLGAPRVMRE